MSYGPLAVATGLMALAAGWDLRRRRIPNALTASVAASGLVSQIATRGWLTGLAALAAAVIVVALLWVPWLKGRLGGGDVKLAAAGALWTGLAHLHLYVLTAALAGGAVAAACYLFSSREVRREVTTNLTLAAVTGAVPELPARGGAGRVSVPYGVAVAMGALATLWTARH